MENKFLKYTAFHLNEKLQFKSNIFQHYFLFQEFKYKVYRWLDRGEAER